MRLWKPFQTFQTHNNINVHDVRWSGLAHWYLQSSDDSYNQKNNSIKALLTDNNGFLMRVGLKLDGWWQRFRAINYIKRSRYAFVSHYHRRIIFAVQQQQKCHHQLNFTYHQHDNISPPLPFIHQFVIIFFTFFCIFKKRDATCV